MRRVALGLTMVILQGISTYVQYGGNVLSFLDQAKVRLRWQFIDSFVWHTVRPGASRQCRA